MKFPKEKALQLINTVKILEILISCYYEWNKFLIFNFIFILINLKSISVYLQILEGWRIAVACRGNK